MERRLDVSALPAPEPMERILDALEGLPAGDWLRVCHRRDPYPLYPILEGDGFAWLTRFGEDYAFEILIWRRGDEAAEAAIGAGSGLP